MTLIINHQAAPEAVFCSPRSDPCLLISRVKDPTGCEGVGGAGVGHAFTRVVRSCRLGNADNRSGCDNVRVKHWVYGACVNAVSVLTDGISVAEMWRRGWRGRRQWSEAGRRLPLAGVAGARGGGHGRRGRGWGWGCGQVLEVLLTWFVLFKATPWINLQTGTDHYMYKYIIISTFITKTHFIQLSRSHDLLCNFHYISQTYLSRFGQHVFYMRNKKEHTDQKNW